MHFPSLVEDLIEELEDEEEFNEMVDLLLMSYVGKDWKQGSFPVALVFFCAPWCVRAPLVFFSFFACQQL